MTGSGRARLGIDLGGTKTEGIVLAADGTELARKRVASARGDYAATIDALATLISDLEADAELSPGTASVGIGMPGSISQTTGLVQNANSTWLNGRPLAKDIEAACNRPVRLENDANCFTLSEAVDGAAATSSSVFGVILGTGCGGSIVLEKRLVAGARKIGGEWGHNPLPWSTAAEHPGPMCWCGRKGCMEAWVSGPALAADHERQHSECLTPEEIAQKAAHGDDAARATLDRHASRLARGLAHVINIVDPDVIVLGGGLSHLAHLYTDLPDLVAPHVFADATTIDIRPPRWGASGGVRGAAWLWDK